MESAGVAIVAHENVRRRMSTDQVIEFFNAERPASPSAALPVITFKQDIAFHFNNEYIEVTHLKNAHTDGDAMIHFRGTNVIHTGDTFFHGRYPFIDTGSGGSVGGIIAAADRIIALSDEKTQIIPGHGELTDKQGVIEYRNMLDTIHKAIATLIVSGNSVEQVVLAKPTAQFDDKWGNAFLKPDTFVKMLYDSIKRATLN
jgi:cyclase